VQVPNRADHGHALDEMAAAVTDRTRVIIVCSPNNPTGVSVTADEFESFMARIPADRLVLLDEAYIEFVRDEASVDGRALLGRYPNLVILRTFSKAYGLAGLRVGYAIGPVAVLDATAIPLGVTAASTAGALASLEPATEAELLERVDAIVERRDRLRAALVADGWNVPAAQGNFIWLPTGAATETTAEALWSAGIVARPFPGDGIRVSVGEEPSVQVVIDTLAARQRAVAL
jgi:histidinol-phosphate aminotransferase